MQVSIVTLFPELYQEFLKTSLVGRASERDLVKFDLKNLLDFCQPKQRVDSPTFGHSSGMLLKPEIVANAIDGQEKKFGLAFKIFLSPKGRKLDQNLVKEISQKLQKQPHLLLLASRYEGVDARVEQEYADLEVSIGDYVLMGGDLPAMVLLETILRYLPGVIGKIESVEKESFSGPFVEYPEYTAPVLWRGHQVPDIVRSGNHAAIEAWRMEQAAERTVFRNFAWLRSYNSGLTDQEKQLVQKYIPEHYVVLMHDQVLLKSGEIGTTSVTTLDLHDIARSAATYGIKNYYIVTPLKDQQKITRTLLDFWQTPDGIEYNLHRHKSISLIKVKNSLDEVIADIKEQAGHLDPVLIGTSAKPVSGVIDITYFDQDKVWEHKKPVLLILGTGHGLNSEVLQRTDFMLGPVEGITNFNHLSVRSAAAIILDRWLGLNPK